VKRLVGKIGLVRRNERQAEFISPFDQCAFGLDFDWKAVPLIPTELLGWYERLCDVTGRQVKGMGDLGGYNSLDPERLSLIVSKYHPAYMVLRCEAARRFPDLPVVYKNSGYSVLKIGDSPGQP